MGFTASPTQHRVHIRETHDSLNWRRARHYADRKAAARLMDRMDRPENIRQELVSRVRAQIANGTYESDAKLDIAIMRLIEDL